MFRRDKLVPTHLDDWRSLGYWRTGEWQLVNERLKDEAQYCPPSADLFAALRAVPIRSCRCAIVGQDPYPQRHLCTGIAFSTPGDLTPSLKNIFKEYEDDLGFPQPTSGNLTPWCEQGVLLWNAYPSCSIGKPGSHHWDEWTYLTKEIVEKLDVKEPRIVFVFLGASARKFSEFASRSHVIISSHPSPLGAKSGFLGSKIFSRVNSCLIELGQEPIDWRLGESYGQPQHTDHQSKR